MEEEAREGQSVFLRGWGDYLRYSLKLTESPAGGARPHGDPRLEPGGARAAGGGDRGERARPGLDRRRRRPRPRLPLHRSRTGTSSRSTTRPSATSPRSTCGPRGGTSRSATSAAARRVKRLDHVNLLAADVRASRVFAQDVLGYRLYERIEQDDGTETGAWMSLSIAAHELIYVADALRRARAAPPPRVLGRHARGVPARGRHLRRQRRVRRGRALEARRRAGLLPLRLRARRQPDRGHDRWLLRLRPGLRADHLDGRRAGARPVLGRQDDRELPHVRHAGRRRGG